jgi:hypothetical protein
MARARLSKFTAGELAGAAGVTLGRGRPSQAVRESLEIVVQEDIAAGKLKVAKGKLVKV